MTSRQQKPITIKPTGTRLWIVRVDRENGSPADKVFTRRDDAGRYAAAAKFRAREDNLRIPRLYELTVTAFSEVQLTLDEVMKPHDDEHARVAALRSQTDAVHSA